MRERMIAVALLVAGATSGWGQSLGEAAAKEAKEKERRARPAASPRTFTDSDLKEAAAKRAKENGPSTASPAPSPSPGSSPVPGSSPAPGASPSSGGGSPAAPKPSADPDPDATEAARKKARGAEYKRQLDAMEAQIKRAEDELANAEKDWRMVEQHPVALANRTDDSRARFEAATRNVAALRSQRTDIEDAARRESIPPGDLR